jgi:hypothetical protein
VSLAGPLFGITLALAASLPLPCLVFFASRRARWGRGLRSLALVISALASCLILSLGYLALQEPGPPTQHSQFRGVDVVLSWSIFGLTHGLVLTALLVLDRRAPTSTGARRRDS